MYRPVRLFPILRCVGALVLYLTLEDHCFSRNWRYYANTLFLKNCEIILNFNGVRIIRQWCIHKFLWYSSFFTGAYELHYCGTMTLKYFFKRFNLFMYGVYTLLKCFEVLRVFQQHSWYDFTLFLILRTFCHLENLKIRKLFFIKFVKVYFIYNLNFAWKLNSSICLISSLSIQIL